MPLFERSTLRSIPSMRMTDVFMTWAVGCKSTSGRVPQGAYPRARYKCTLEVKKIHGILNYKVFLCVTYALFENARILRAK